MVFVQGRINTRDLHYLYNKNAETQTATILDTSHACYIRFPLSDSRIIAAENILSWKGPSSTFPVCELVSTWKGIVSALENHLVLSLPVRK